MATTRALGFFTVVVPVLEGEPKQRRQRILGLAGEHTKLGFGFVFPVGCSLCFTRFCPATVLGL